MTLLFAALVGIVAQDLSSEGKDSSGPFLSSDTVANPRTGFPAAVQQRTVEFFQGELRKFNDIDTTYIEPQHYNFAVMLQNTNTYEIYSLRSEAGQSIRFAPRPTYRVGPYFGWRWLFLGYTFDVRHLSNESKKTEFDLSIYSNLLSLDLYYRKTGNDYYIREIDLRGIGRRRLDHVAFDGLNVGITGVNIHYIFNHQKFSYPAAFSQSTVQRKSCGSALAGIGFTRHSIHLDYKRLEQVVRENVPELHGDDDVIVVDSSLSFDKVKYTDISLSGGYAYDWVPARNWLVAGSLSLALGYKRSSGALRKDERTLLTDFSFRNLSVDGIGRFAIVWNDTKWYAGMNAILHAYTYKKRQLSANNFFGTLNFYVGFNFGRKKE